MSVSTMHTEAISNSISIPQETTIQSPVLTPIKASKYIGIDTDIDALKSSRSTGILWGVEAPEFIKAGSKKILYPISGLDKFLSQFQRYTNNAQIAK